MICNHGCLCDGEDNGERDDAPVHVRSEVLAVGPVGRDGDDGDNAANDRLRIRELRRRHHEGGDQVEEAILEALPLTCAAIHIVIVVIVGAGHDRVALRDADPSQVIVKAAAPPFHRLRMRHERKEHRIVC